MKIDLSRLITADDKASAEARARSVLASGVCRRRIVEVCNETAQMNLAAAAAAGFLVSAELETYRAGLVWVAAMRAAWRPIAASGADPEVDGHWPAVPSGVAELATRF